MNKLNYLKLLHPRFWLMLSPYNKLWDDANYVEAVKVGLPEIIHNV